MFNEITVSDYTIIHNTVKFNIFCMYCSFVVTNNNGLNPFQTKLKHVKHSSLASFFFHIFYLALRNMVTV